MRRLLLVLACVLLCNIAGYSQSLGGMFHFDGMDDVVSIPSHPSYTIGTGNFSLEFWMRMDSSYIDSSTAIITMRDSTTGKGFSVEIIGRRFYFLSYLSPSSSGQHLLSYSLSSISYDQTCHHYTIVRSGGHMYLFVDGEKVATTSFINSAVELKAASIVIGGLPAWFGNQDYFKGDVGSFRFWSCDININQIINQLHLNDVDRLGNLIGYWKFDNTYRQKVADFSTKKNHGYRGLTNLSDVADPVSVSSCPKCTIPNLTVTSLDPLSICEGDTARLKVNLNQGEVCQWYLNGYKLSGGTDSIFFARYTGFFHAKVANQAGCVSYSNQVYVKRLLEEIGSVSCAGCYGQSSKFCWWQGRVDTISLPLVAKATYQWYKDGVQIPNAITNKLVVSAEGNYTCEVKKKGCTKISTPAKFAPYRAWLQPNTPIKTCLDTMVTISVETNKGHIANYKWYVNGSLVPGATSGTITTNLTGWINCILVDTLLCPGQTTTNSLNIAHGVTPDLFIYYHDSIIQTGSDLSICSPYTSCSLEAKDAYGVYYTDAGLISKQWVGTQLTTPYTNNWYTTSRSGDYAFGVTTACGMKSTGSIDVLFAGPGADSNLLYPFIQNSSCYSVYLRLDNLQLSWNAIQWYKGTNPIPGATNNTYAATQSGSYSCVVWNSCDSVVAYPESVTITSEFYKINAFYGTDLCPGGTVQLDAYYGASSYQWMKNGVNIPGATLKQYKANTTGTYSCLMTGNCGPILSNSIVVGVCTTTLPPNPGSITGPTVICPVNGLITYSIAPVPGASSYFWSLSSGINAVGNQHIDSVILGFSQNFQGGKLKVYAYNNCSCAFLIDSLMISSQGVLSPASIQGNTKGVCNSVEVYSCPLDTAAVSYAWSVPSNVQILSGQGTNTLTVQFPPNFVSDTIRVSAVNGCMTSVPRTLIVSGAPDSVAAISGPSTACAMQTGISFKASSVFGATSYNWTVPAGATIVSGQGADSIQVDMGAAGGFISVSAQNNCGSSTVFSKQITVTCKEGESLLPEQIQLVIERLQNQLIVHSTLRKGVAEVILYDALGRLIGDQRIDTEWEGEAIFSNLSSGIYFVELRQGNERMSEKAMVY